MLIGGSDRGRPRDLLLVPDCYRQGRRLGRSGGDEIAHAQDRALGLGVLLSSFRALVAGRAASLNFGDFDDFDAHFIIFFHHLITSQTSTAWRGCEVEY